MAPAARVYAGLTNTAGTNTFNNNLTLASGAVANLDLGTVASGTTSNSLFRVSGNLTFNGNTIRLWAPSTSASLDTNTDYPLFSVSGTLSGTPLPIPVWGNAPANASNFFVLTNSHQVLLHYYSSTSLPPTGVGSITPTNLYVGQSGAVTVTVTPGGSSTIKSVVLNLGALGGTTENLVLSNANVWTNVVTIPNNNLAGIYNLTALITDGNNEVGVAIVSINVAAGKFWTGAGTPNANWSDAANWLAQAAPSVNSGDSVTFAGTVNTSPVMDNSYIPLAGVTFFTNAAPFTLMPSSGLL